MLRIFHTVPVTEVEGAWKKSCELECSPLHRNWRKGFLFCARSVASEQLQRRNLPRKNAENTKRERGFGVGKCRRIRPRAYAQFN